MTRLVAGLTAALVRKDGHHPIVLFRCRPLRFQVSPKAEAAARSFEQVVIPRVTGLRLSDGVYARGIQSLDGAPATDERLFHIVTPSE